MVMLFLLTFSVLVGSSNQNNHDSQYYLHGTYQNVLCENKNNSNNETNQNIALNNFDNDNNVQNINNNQNQLTNPGILKEFTKKETEKHLLNIARTLFLHGDLIGQNKECLHYFNDKITFCEKAIENLKVENQELRRQIMILSNLINKKDQNHNQKRDRLTVTSEFSNFFT